MGVEVKTGVLVGLMSIVGSGSKVGSTSSLDKLGTRPDHSQKHTGSTFKMWSLFPFITRDIAVWVPEAEGKDNLEKLLKENMTDLCVKGPDVFDSFTKPASPEGGDGKTSFGFRMVFQSYEKTLTDIEVNEIMQKITDKVKENKNWEVR